jgi:hypothetical protein
LGIDEGREKQRLSTESQRRGWTNSHKGKFPELAAWGAMWVPERLVKFHGPLITPSELAEFAKFITKGKTEPKEQDSKLLEYLVINAAHGLANY